MQILSFKDWFENKEKNKPSGINRLFIAEKVNSLFYKLNPKVLTLHIDESTGGVLRKDHKITRYLIDDSIVDEVLLWKMREFVIQECHKEDKRAFLVGYDTSTLDSKKAFKSAKKIAESFKNKLALDFVQVKSFGNIEKINDTIPDNTRDFNRNRIELWIVGNDCLEESAIEKEIPFHFNPNDFSLIDKYKTSLRCLLYKLILKENKKDIKISAMKNWPSSRKIELNESLKKEENSKDIILYKYPLPGKSVYLSPENKPSPLLEKITVKKLTEQRASSICDFLNNYSQNYNFSFIPMGSGVKEGKSRIEIEEL